MRRQNEPRCDSIAKCCEAGDAALEADCCKCVGRRSRLLGTRDFDSDSGRNPLGDLLQGDEQLAVSDLVDDDAQGRLVPPDRGDAYDSRGDTLDAAHTAVIGSVERAT